MLSLVGFIGVIVATYFVYKTARDSGRRPVGWALLTFFGGFGLQFVLPLLIGITIGIVWILSGVPVEYLPRQIQGPAAIIDIVCIALSLVFVILIARQAAKIPEEESFVQPPSPPAGFTP